MTSPGPHPSTPTPQLLLLAGPTAVGKSEVVLLLAERLNGEIVTVDSMQVYRGLDIGTAKPSPADRARIPHHLIDVVDLTEPFDAAQFARLAHKAVTEIQSRGRVPILCGGTGLYFKAFLEGLGEAPPADLAMRAELEATPLPELLKELEQRDPATFARIDRQNPRRVIRAMEVIRLTGKPFSVQRTAWHPASSIQYPVMHFQNPVAADVSPLHSPRSQSGLTSAATIWKGTPVSGLWGLTRSPADLHSRIDARVDAMFQRGLVAETEQLLKRGLEQNKTAMQAIGYRQVVEHLRDVRSLPETIALVKIRTRQFAKRQLTWFRRQTQLTWIQLQPQDKPDTLALRIVDKTRLPCC